MYSNVTKLPDIPSFIEEAVAVPYVPFGRDYSGWDCWGLIYVAYRDLLGITLPSYVGRYSDPEARKEVAALLQDGRDSLVWHEVEKPKLLDLVLLKISGDPWHVGLFVQQNWMLHSWKDGTHCIRLSSIVWNKRIAGFFRHHSRLEGR